MIVQQLEHQDQHQEDIMQVVVEEQEEHQDTHQQEQAEQVVVEQEELEILLDLEC